MSEWWTYRPADFLMFAPRTYWRLFELHNAQWWPLQWLLLVAACVVVARAARGGTAVLRVGAAGLAATWVFVSASFLLQRYAPINWAAGAFAAAFVLQAAVLVLLATRTDLHATRRGSRRAVGALLVGWALVGHPLLAAAAGRPWKQAEVFGIAPDPTAIATLGALLWADHRTRATGVLLRAARVVPIGWCAISAATLLTMGSAQAWVTAAAAAGAAAALAVDARPRERRAPSL
jgi:hypothetical protein